MTLRLLIAACSLLAAAACATPTERARPQAGLQASAAPGEIVTAQPGEAVYTETTARYVWTLTVSRDARIGPYTVEAGEYAMTGLSRDGYFFDVGDDCAGEPAVITQARFADSPEHILLTADGTRTCIVPVFDHARCAPRLGDMGYALAPGETETVTTLVYDGPATGFDQATRWARFTLMRETGLERRERALTALVGAPLEIDSTRFQVIAADQDHVVLEVEDRLTETPALAPPVLDELD